METLKYNKLKLLYKKGDYKGLNKFIDDVEWKEAFDGKSIKGAYSRFLEIYNEACKLFIPKITPITVGKIVNGWIMWQRAVWEKDYTYGM